MFSTSLAVPGAVALVVQRVPQPDLRGSPSDID
jgi:hypothetical protein